MNIRKQLGGSTSLDEELEAHEREKILFTQSLVSCVHSAKPKDDIETVVALS